ncbi:MAG: thrombospondin type 3 repeat-containing protein, partial [Gammaproteobacteria bacterium]|nr:thrombospondin type 3 repeat-containing protein [Gammaproteobacteria bacterium]
GDGIGDNADTDRDGDGVLNENDAFPNDPNESSDLDGDGLGDNADTDRDGDGVLNENDAFPNDPNESSDLDSDGIGDNADTDRDGDGVLNENDAFPNDPNESSDLDGDGIGDNADTDRDGDGVLNENDAFPNDPNESSDLDGDGIGDNADTDRDGDGVDNTDDAYPEDGSRSTLEQVSNIQLQLDGTSARLSWSSISVNTIVENIAVLRAEFGGTYTQVALLPLSSTQYIDASVVNAQAYQYQLVSVTSTNVRSENNPVQELFVAYNQNSIDNLTAQQQEKEVLLDWQTIDADEIIIRRAQASFPMTQIDKVSSTGYTDSNVVVPNQYRYQLVNRRYFSNPINNENFYLDGPASDSVLIDMLQPIEIVLQAEKVGQNVYEQKVNNSTVAIALKGSVLNAVTEANLIASNGSETINVKTSKDFTLELPIAEPNSPWQIIAQSGSMTTSATLNIALDGIDPTLLIDGASERTTEQSELTFTGTVSDDDKVIGVSALSDQFGAQAFRALLQTDGSFSVEIPLEDGINQITFIAEDTSGNKSQQLVKVTKNNTLLPALEITSHTYGDVVTEQPISISGRVTSDLPPEQIKILLGALASEVEPASDGAYRFSFESVSLIEGLNNFTFEAQSPVGQIKLPFALTYNENQPDIDPELTIIAPLNGAYISDDTFVLQGEIYSPSKVVSVSINGQAADFQRSGSESAYFNFPLDLQSDSLVVDVTVIASNGLSTQQQLTYYRDNSAPQIIIDNNLMVSPAVNTINELPYTISGRVVDDNVSSLTINDRPVQLTPGSNNNEFNFTVAVNVENQVDTNIHLQAYDLSGNVTSESLVLRAESAASIDIIAPSGQTDFKSNDTSFNLQVIARVKGTMDSDRVRLSIDQQTPIFVDVNETLVNTSVVMSGSSGEHNLRMEIINAANQVIYQTSREFKITNQADIPLELVKTEPYNGQQGTEPNGYLAIYTNKSIDPTLLSFDVRETANGKTYINNDAPGLNFLQAKGYQLTTVSRMNELVNGGISRVPGDNIVAFYPSRQFAYNADVAVRVNYDGEELTRFAFKVRPLPTFLTGSVFDQLDQAVAGVKVELPELGRSVITDEEGTFAFGFGDSADKALPQGTYRLVINRNFANPRFGASDRQITIEAGRKNEVGIIKTPVLDSQVAFNLLETGKQNDFAAGELLLDLTDAQATFGNGSSSGRVHVSFVEISGIDAKATPIAYPSWVYTVQPAGIKVSGKLNLEIKIPKLYNSYDYVPESGTYVTLIGRDSNTNTLTPVGVGVIDGYTVKSVGNVNLQRLDFIGYSFVADDKQAALQRYANNEISIQALMALLGTE